MKKYSLNLFALIVVILTGVTKLNAQPTTEEEYNYVTKGYKIQFESGLDMKAGYSLKDIGEWYLKFGDASRGFVFKGLYRGSDTRPCCVMAIYQKKINDKKKPE